MTGRTRFARYRRAADHGHVRAMNLVGPLPVQRLGRRPRDPAGPRRWYRRSAEAGYFRGQYNYASMPAGRGAGARSRRPWFEAALAGVARPEFGLAGMRQCAGRLLVMSPLRTAPWSPRSKVLINPAL